MQLYAAAIVHRLGEGRGEDRECLIEIYHYTLICVIYCAAIERQQRETGSRTHTQKHTHVYTHAHAVLPVGQ